MPIYKQRPRSKNKVGNLPLYRPIDQLFISLWEGRGKFLPILIAVAAIALLGAGFRLYAAHTDRLAWELFEQKKLGEVAQRYPRSPAAAVARLEEGYQALNEKRYDAAIAAYEPLTHRRESFFRIVALQNLGLAYREKGDWASAIDALRRAETDSGNAAPEYTRSLKEDTEKKWEALSSPETLPDQPPAP